MREALSRLERAISKFSLTVGIVAIIGMVFLIIPEVVGRYLFSHSFGVSEEFSAYLLVTAIFMGLAYVASEDGHISVRILTLRLPKYMRDRLRIFTILLFLLLSVILVKTSYELMFRNYSYGSKSMFSTETPLWMPMVPIVVGFGLLCIIIIIHFIRSIGELRRSRQ